MTGLTMSARAALVLSTGALVVLTSAATVLLALNAASIVGSAASLSPLPSAAGVRAPGSEVVMLPNAIVDLDHSVLRPRASTVAAAGPRPEVDPEPILRYPVGAVIPANAPHALPRVLPGPGQIKPVLVKPEPSTGPSVSPQRDRVEREKADRVKGSSLTEKTDPSAKKRTTRRSRAG